MEEAAEAYLYLMRASYVTGQVLRIDGGREPGVRPQVPSPLGEVSFDISK